jgi:hypothetical protein
LEFYDRLNETQGLEKREALLLVWWTWTCLDEWQVCFKIEKSKVEWFWRNRYKDVNGSGLVNETPWTLLGLKWGSKFEVEEEPPPHNAIKIMKKPCYPLEYFTNSMELSPSLEAASCAESRTSHHLMEWEGSLPCPRESSTGLSFAPHQPMPYNTIPSL